MANRKQLINRHSGIENKIPISDLSLGEIGINHCNVTDAAIYIETNKDNPSSATLATFITEKAINNKVNGVVEIVENLIDTVEKINSGLTEEIERATTSEDSISGDVTTLARATKDEFKNIVDIIKTVSGSAIDGLTELSASTVSEIERAVSADTVLDGEIKLVDSALTIETERATSAETALQATIEENEEIISSALNGLNGRLNDLNEKVDDSETSIHEEINQLKTKIGEMEEVISAALNDLNERLNKIDGGNY